MTADAERLAAIRSEIESGHDGKTWQAYETAVGAEYFAVEENRGLFAAKLAPVTGTPTYGRDEILHAIALHNGAPALLAELDRLIAENDALQARIEAVVVRCRAALAVKVADSDAGDAACAALAAVILREDLELDIRSAPAGDQPEATPEPPHLDPEPMVCLRGECGVKRHSASLLMMPGVRFEPRGFDENGKAYSQDRDDYGVQW